MLPRPVLQAMPTCFINLLESVMNFVAKFINTIREILIYTKYPTYLLSLSDCSFLGLPTSEIALTSAKNGTLIFRCRLTGKYLDAQQKYLTINLVTSNKIAGEAISDWSLHGDSSSDQTFRTRSNSSSDAYKCRVTYDPPVKYPCEKFRDSSNTFTEADSIYKSPPTTMPPTVGPSTGTTPHSVSSAWPWTHQTKRT